jgi:Protein of unknown function (DUF4197)
MSVRTVPVSVMWLVVAASFFADRDEMVLAQARGLSDATIASGLKEALQVGTQNAISLTGRPDGYFQNAAIKILMPSPLQPIEKGLRAVGYGPQVDELVLSMNRAAERAAPAAKPIFLKAITAMSFDDARKIVTGRPTAATEYFKGKTSEKLTAAFQPVVAQTMGEVGVTRQYQELMGRAQAIPFLKSAPFDLDRCVVGKSLDGLFYVLGQEEQKIRTNPTARATDLLTQVFGR